MVYHQRLGGTSQHLLYFGIIHNFPDNQPEVDHLIDYLDGIETATIEHGTLPSDFVIFTGRRPGSGQ